MFRLIVATVWMFAVASSTVAFAQGVSIPEEWFYDGANRPAELKSLEGQPAPELDGAEWIRDPIKLSDLKGKVVVVDFWATWCGPCMAAIPENVEMVEEFKDKPMALIGVHDSQNGWNQASKVVKDKRINYPITKDSGSSAKKYKLQFWPTYVVIDHKGIVRAAGLMPTHVKSVVEMLLKDVPSSGTAALGSNPDAWYVSPAERRPDWIRAIEGKQLPDLSSQAWIGSAPAEDAFKGKITVVSLLGAGGDFSAAHCHKLQSLHSQFSSAGVRFVGVYRTGTDAEGVKSMFEREKYEFFASVDVSATAAEGIDPSKMHGSIAAALGVRFWPIVLITDRSGKVRVSGAHPERISDALTVLLAEPIEVNSGENESVEQVQGKESK